MTRRRQISVHAPRRLALDDLSPAVRSAILSLEWPECGCDPPLVSSCLLGVVTGCRQRRRCGMCECDRRELPRCLLLQPHGCQRRQLGKFYLADDEGEAEPPGYGESCGCPTALVPQCLVEGCSDRQDGRLCDCPRTPSAVCEHMGYAARMRIEAGFLTLKRLCPPEIDPYDLWAFALWSCRPKVYADKELPGAPADMSDRTEAVARMELRETLGVALRHPDDQHAVAGESETARLGLQLRKFANLIRDRKEAGRGSKAA